MGRLVFSAACIVGPLLAVQMYVDWLLDLSVLIRGVILLAEIATLTWFMGWILLPVLRKPPSLRDCALMVEKAWPQVIRGSVIASVQLAEPRITEDSSELVQRLHMLTITKTGPLRFGRLVNTAPFYRPLYLAFVICVVVSVIFLNTLPASFSLLERVFLLPVGVPRETSVICLSGNKTISLGSSVLLEAKAEGVIPDDGTATITDENGEQKSVAMEKETDHPDEFGVKIDNVQKPFSYSIQLNDGTSDSFHVQPGELASIEKITFTQIFPAYTCQAPMKRTAGDLALLAGSRLQFQAFASSPIKTAEAELIGIDRVIDLNLDVADPRKFSGEISIPASGLKGFYIKLTDEKGLTSGADKPYQIEVVPDRAPEIKLTFPKRPRELCTLNLKPKLSFIASDDFGIGEIDLVYRIIADQPPAEGTIAQPPQRQIIEIDKDHPKNREGDYLWDLSAIEPPLKEGVSVEYWLQAQDDNDVTGPGIGESEHHVFKIVTEAEKRTEVMSRLIESLNSITDLSKKQEMLNGQLKDAIKGKENSN